MKGFLLFIVYPKGGNFKAEVTKLVFRYIERAIEAVRVDSQQYLGGSSPHSSQGSQGRAGVLERQKQLNESIALLLVDGDKQQVFLLCYFCRSPCLLHIVSTG